LVFALGAALFTASCSPIYRNHGYIPTDEDLALVQVGTSTRDEVATAVGRPASSGLLEGGDWYYVGSRWKHFGARAPQEIDRQVVAVTFNDAGVVDNVERFGLQEGRVVVLSRRVTESNVRSLGLIRQLMGSLGRVSAGDILN
jgi:outer membrane protein assembly factor BamE (lipoprotein component of BamABCDE complex)